MGDFNYLRTNIDSKINSIFLLDGCIELLYYSWDTQSECWKEDNSFPYVKRSVGWHRRVERNRWVQFVKGRKQDWKNWSRFRNPKQKKEGNKYDCKFSIHYARCLSEKQLFIARNHSNKLIRISQDSNVDFLCAITILSQ